jgi:hypothetical protein
MLNARLDCRAFFMYEICPQLLVNHPAGNRRISKIENLLLLLQIVYCRSVILAIEIDSDCEPGTDLRKERLKA